MFGPRRARKMVVIVVAFGVAAALAIEARTLWQAGKASESWPSVTGKITDRRTETRRQGRGPSRAWETHVEYTVEGKTYHGVFNDYEMAETITVYYDAKNPQVATTDQGVDWNWFIGYCLAALLAVATGLATSALTLWPHLASAEEGGDF